VEVPWFIVRILGDPYIVKLCAFMVSVMVVAALTLPEVPLIVRAYWPSAAEVVAASVRTVLPVAGFGENEAVTPLGSPETEKFTPPVNPNCELTYTYDVAELPCPIVGLE
jgi:hypothetical protein